MFQMMRKSRIPALLLALLLALSLVTATGCSSNATDTGEADQAATETVEATFPVTVTDDLGREVTVESEPEKIVSLAPANTEIVAALGLIDRLVGVTTFCDYPPEVADIEKVGDFVGPNLEAIAALEPDLVLATTGVQEETVTQLEDLGAVVVAVDPQSLDDVFDSIEMVGAVTGATQEAADLNASIQEDLDAVEEAITDDEPVTCFLEIAQDPLFTVGSGTLQDDMIAAAGGENVVKEEGYVGYSVEQLVTDDPEVYMATMGSMSDPAELQSRAGYESLTAVKEGRVYVLDDNLVSRPGPRVAQGVQAIAAALHPELAF